MIEVFEGSDARLEIVHQVRLAAFTGSRRDQAYVQAWTHDPYDPHCRHIVMTDASGEPIACMRIAVDGRWPVEDRYDGPLDKSTGVEFGRLSVSRRDADGKRTMYEVVTAACRYVLGIGRDHMYGMTIEPLWTAFQRAGIPLTVLTGPMELYGVEGNLILFEARKLIDFYESQPRAQ